MIQFEEVSLAYGGHPLFKSVSFILQKREKCGLLGRNGSGKSTLLKLATKELEPDEGVVTLPKNYRIGYLQQHIRFTKQTVLEEASLGLPLEERALPYKVEKILFGLGFTEKDMGAHPSIFSGGYHLRLHLAKVLASEPECLLLDEPTNYLDILSIRWLVRFLHKWEGELILISHDRAFMDSVTTHTMGIHRHKVKKFPGTTLKYFEQILAEEEVYEKTRLKAEKKREHLEKFITRFGAKATKAAQAQSKKKILEKEGVLEKLGDLAELSFSFYEAPFSGKKMVEVCNACFSHTKDPLIKDFSIEIGKGERVAVIGKNGLGKSTLLRLMSGDHFPHQGFSRISENAQIGFFDETHIDRLSADHTIEEEIAAANPDLTYSEVKAIAGLMMFSGSLAEKKIALLSGGERSRVLLGKIIARPCNLLLLDEPTHHLDVESIEAFMNALDAFSGAIVIVTHSELILRRLALDKIVHCGRQEQAVFLGTYDEFLEKRGWDEEEKAPLPKKVSRPQPKPKTPSLRSLFLSIEECEKKIIFLEERVRSLAEKEKISPEESKELALFSKELEIVNAKYNALHEELKRNE